MRRADAVMAETVRRQISGILFAVGVLAAVVGGSEVASGAWEPVWRWILASGAIAVAAGIVGRWWSPKTFW